MRNLFGALILLANIGFVLFGWLYHETLPPQLSYLTAYWPLPSCALAVAFWGKATVRRSGWIVSGVAVALLVITAGLRG